MEYPDGAPPEVIREMKEPDDTMPFHPKRSGGVKRPIKSAPSSGGLKLARQAPLARPSPSLPEPESRAPEPEQTTSSPPTESDPVTSSPPPEGMERSKRLRVFPKTDKCPACQSGMEAPGIRRSAACKRKRLEFERIQAEESSSPHADSAMDVIPASPVPPPAPSPEPVTVPAEIRAADLRGRKRESEQSAEDLEAEMHEGNDTMELESVSLDLRWSDNGDYMMSPMQLEIHGQKCLATSPEFFDDLISSVKFSPDKKHTFCKMTLGGASVLVWKPDGLVDDSSLMSLDNEQGFEGMKEEIRNLEHCRTGRIINYTELTALKAQNPHLRLIPSRWVSAYKSPTRVRARIVAKDLNRGVSARKLGISSPTPSVDGLHFVLALAAQRQWQLKGLDVAHAFMHSPIPKSECIVLQMPQSVSLEDGSLAYLVLYRALNGLRDASLAWLNLLSESIKAVGLVTDDMEPCIYQGCIRRKGRQVGSAILIAYVDDLLLCSDSDEVERIVEETIGAVVPLKETGKIKKAAQGGGSLIFIGRHIFRDGQKNDLRLGVDPKFLDAVFKEFNISKGSAAIPDVAAHIEKTVDDANAQVPLSAEAYSRFRRALGKLLWMAQVRHDIKIYLSLIGSQQAAPMSGTESAIRAILRFLYSDMSTMLSIPSPEYFEHACPGWDEVGVVHAFSDASHAPYRFNGRRSITGGAIFAEGTLIKTTAKQQQSVALSSCEAELYALQAVSQEAIALSAFCMRIYAGLEECTRETTGYVVMESDSESALTLIAGKDVPKKSRHIEIRLHWMRSKIEAEELALKFKPGTENCSDLFTKCLSTKDFVRHRTTLGFTQHEVPIGDLNSLREILLTGVSASVGQEMAFIEVCCSENSALRQACKVARMPYLGITKNMQERRVLDEVKAFVVLQRNSGRWLHVHCSTPCSSGSPLKHLNQKREQTEADRDWHSIIGSAEAYLTLGDSRSFELPKHNQIWQRPETQRILERCGLNYDAEVALCQTGLVNDEGTPIGKRLKFFATSPCFANLLTRKFGTCACRYHAEFNTVNWHRTGYYSKTLAKAILAAARSSRREPC